MRATVTAARLGPGDFVVLDGTEHLFTLDGTYVRDAKMGDIALVIESKFNYWYSLSVWVVVEDSIFDMSYRPGESVEAILIGAKGR